MCRPAVPNLFSSGWHLHQSLVERRRKVNAFAGGVRDGLSAAGVAFLGGLLAHAHAAAAFTTPTVNGYKRYRPYTLAPDRAYTCGLFENSGMALMLVHAPGYSHTVSQAGDGLALMERERVRYGVDHATLGQALMRTWGLPEELALAVRHHHRFSALQGEMPLLTRQLVALSAMANAVLSSAQTEWLRDRELIADLLETSMQTLQHHFDECTAAAH